MDYQSRQQVYDEYSSQSKMKVQNETSNLTLMLNEYVKDDDRQMFLQIVRYNGGDAQRAIQLYKDQVQNPQRCKEFPKVRNQIQNYIQSTQCDRDKVTELNEKLMRPFQQIQNIAMDFKFQTNYIMNCMNKNLSNNLNEPANSIFKTLISSCQWGASMTPLKQQISFIMGKKLPKVVNKNQVIQELISMKTFNKVNQIRRATQQEKEQFIQHVKALKAWEQNQSFGQNFLNLKLRFVKVTALKLCQVVYDWKDLYQMMNNLIQNPMHDFSSSQTLSNQVKKFIYEQIYSLKQFEQYRNIKIRAKSLKSKQYNEIIKIINFISTKFTCAEFKELQNLLENYQFAEFYSNDKVTTMKLPKLYKFIEQCKDYWKIYEQVYKKDKKQKDYIQTQNLKSQLTIKLRRYLLQINVSFQLHERIQQMIFAKNTYQLLNEALTNKQKKDLISKWIHNNMKQYYLINFHSIDLRYKARKQVMGSLIVQLNLEYPYKRIDEFVNQMLDNKLSYVPNQYFSASDVKIIKKVFEKWEVYKIFCMNQGTDFSLWQFQAENVLVNQILLPTQIGNLHGNTIKCLVKKYIEYPAEQTILKEEINKKNQLLRLIRNNQQLRQFGKNMQKYTFNKKKQNLKKCLQQNLYDFESGYDLVYRLIEKYGRLNFDQGSLILQQNCTDQQLKELALQLQQNEQNALKVVQCQQKEEYIEFLYVYPDIIQNKKANCKKSLQFKIEQNIESGCRNFRQERIPTLIKALVKQDFNLSRISNYPPDVIRFIQNQKEYQQLKEIIDIQVYNSDLINQIKYQRKIKTILQLQTFSKYPKEEKNQILIQLNNGEDLNNIIKKFFSTKDSQILNEILNQQNQSQPEDIQQQQQQQQQKITKSIKKIDKQLQTPSKKVKSSAKDGSTIKSSSKNSNSKIKTVEPKDWKLQIESKYKQNFNTMTQNMKLLEVAGNQLKEYQQKQKICEEYRNILQNKKVSSQNKINQIINKNNESLIASIIESSNVKITEFIIDFDWGNGTHEAVKQKYNIKMKAKFENIIKQLKEQSLMTQINTMKNINQELSKLKEIASLK